MKAAPEDEFADLMNQNDADIEQLFGKKIEDMSFKNTQSSANTWGKGTGNNFFEDDTIPGNTLMKYENFLNKFK